MDWHKLDTIIDKALGEYQILLSSNRLITMYKGPIDSLGKILTEDIESETEK